MAWAWRSGLEERSTGTETQKAGLAPSGSSGIVSPSKQDEVCSEICPRPHRCGLFLGVASVGAAVCEGTIAFQVAGTLGWAPRYLSLSAVGCGSGTGRGLGDRGHVVHIVWCVGDTACDNSRKRALFQCFG